MIWLVPITFVLAAERALAHATPVARLLGICTALFFGMKAVVLAREPLPWDRRLALFLLWPGMRPRLFSRLRRRRGGRRLVVEGCARVALGVALILLARAIDSIAVLVVGMSLVLHFGLFRIAAGLARLAGVNARPLFDNPLRSASLAQFWSKRWNRAFSEMTQIAVHRPLASRAGPGVATAAGFAFSGVLHELVITVPAGGGYGLPLLYFCLHAMLVRLPLRGRIWTAACVLVPLPLLVPAVFVEGVLRPLL